MKSFRDYARNPEARQITSRVFDESADTAENRYLRHILAVSRKVADAYVFAGSQHPAFLDRLASRESERARCNRELEIRVVDPEVFDQTKEIEQKLDAIAKFEDLAGDAVGRATRPPAQVAPRSPSPGPHWALRLRRQASSTSSSRPRLLHGHASQAW